MCDDDGLAYAVDLSADDPRVLVRSESRLVRWEIDRVCAVPTALERRNEALPAGGRLACAVDEDEVAQPARPVRVIQARPPDGVSAPGRNRTSARGLGNRCSIH
jgi:hypothetical protein